MDSTRVWDQLRNLERGVQDVRSELARMPVERGKVRTSPAITVYEFRACADNDQVLYADNTSIAEHESGEVAAIDRDGIINCWELIGPAPHCKTGECVLILGWGTDCEACNGCFNLWLCGGGSPVVVQGIEWMQYVGRVVLIDTGSGAQCREVEQATACASVTAFTVDDIEAVYDDCNLCGCYQLTHCDNPATTKWINDDLAGLLGMAVVDIVNETVIELPDGCWSVSDFESPCTQLTVETLGLEDVTVREGCTECCFILIPCAGNPETTKKVKPCPTDTIDLRDYVNEDGTSNGRVFMDVDFNCWAARRPVTSGFEVNEDCEGAITCIGTVREEYESCECCGLTCWERCDSPGTYIRTYSDLCEYKRSGVALKRAEDGLCYEYESSMGTCGEPAIVEFTVEKVFEHATLACDICQDPRYKLTPGCGGCEGCEGGSGTGSTAGTAIVSNQEELHEAVGQYVKVEGRCYLVELTTDTVTRSDLCWTGPYAHCAACDAAPSRIKFVTKRGDDFFLTEIEGSFKVCNEAAVTEPCTV